jgi:hypothetical protein
MGQQIKDLADANGLLLREIRRREAALGKTNQASGKDEAVVSAASHRDRLKYIPRRMN